jgi:DNA end-binding protein Ku
MKIRCIWSGHLKVSLVTIGVRVYSALDSGEKIAFHQLHKGCHQRVRQKLVCPMHGEVKREDLVKGYEYTQDRFVVMEEADFDKVRLDTTGAIELVQFIRPEELDPTYLDVPYFLGPDGPVAEEGFAVLAKALARTRRIGVGQVVIGGKEKLVSLKPLGKGFILYTLRYATEIRSADPFFETLQDRILDESQVALAQKLIESKSTPFQQANLTDRYQTALLGLIKAKIEGTEPVLAPRNGAAQVISLMGALRQSLAQNGSNDGEQRTNGPLRPSRNNGSSRKSHKLGAGKAGRRLSAAIRL